jgi:hypothetical protein
MPDEMKSGVFDSMRYSDILARGGWCIAKHGLRASFWRASGK